MTRADKQLLLRQAQKLTTLALVAERERSKLKKLVERGFSHDDQEMLQTLKRFKTADAKWKQREAEHLQMKRKVL